MNNLRKTDTYLHFGNLCSAKETVDGQVLGPLEIEKRYRIGTYAILSGANWGRISEPRVHSQLEFLLV